VIQTSQREEMILNGEFGVQSYNPNSGEKYWFCKNFNGRGSPTPAYNEDTVYVVSGKPGDIYAIRTNGSGDVSDKMLWHTARGRGRDLPSPMLMGKYLLVVNMKGSLTCYEASNGEVLWVEQLPRDDYIASPLIAEGMLYIVGNSGRISIIKPGPKFELVNESQITPEDRKEVFRSSIAVSEQKFFIRSSRYLYCVKK
jgi:outer membrane protein assembly factor BamB